MWVPVGQLEERDLIRHAQDHGQVRLDDGRIVRLVGWPGPGHLRSRRGRYCRLENANGTHFTLHVNRVAEVNVMERNQG